MIDLYIKSQEWSSLERPHVESISNHANQLLLHRISWNAGVFRLRGYSKLC
jgi:hypothetical protein